MKRITTKGARSPDDTSDEEVSRDVETKGEWFADEEYDGQLAVDVYQLPDAIVIRSAIAGVEPDDLDISVHHDLVTIRGRRKLQENVPKEDFLHQECYWGSFSRSIILPVEVDGERVTATLRSGILRVTLPKTESGGPHKVIILDEE